MLISKQGLVDIRQTTAILNISEATLRNWIKQSFIRPETGNQGKIAFHPKDIVSLQKSLAEGAINKLKSRANKRSVASGFIPSEYMGEAADKHYLAEIVAIKNQHSACQEEVIFILSLKLLFDRKLLPSMDFTQAIRFDASWPSLLKKELHTWYSQLKNPKLSSLFQALKNTSLPSCNDPLGLIYQSLQTEGDKSKNGSYYTPSEIVDDILNTYINPNKQAFKVLDPCCGSGQFLMRVMEHMPSNVCVHGFDNDPLAVKIARINVLLKKQDADPGIVEQDFLLPDETIREEYDLIVSNPPWGSHFEKDVLQKLQIAYPEIQSQEAFSYFLAAGLRALKPDGVLSFILPESILHVKAHKDIRKLLLEHTQIERIICLNRVFKKVFTPVIRLDIRKKAGQAKNIYIHTGKDEYILSQKRFSENTNCEFDIYNSEVDDAILQAVYKNPYTTLKGQADWALGIVTGNNAGFISKTKKTGYEALIKGSDIGPFQMRKPSSFIRFVPSQLQQVAPESKYRAAEKLIYRFISKDLVFAYDNHQHLCLNSANCLIPCVENYPVKAIMTLFNSALYQYIFHKKFNTIKVLRNHLEELPLPLWNQKVLNELVCYADKRMAGKVSEDETSAMNITIMRNFGLSAQQITTILNSK